MLVDQYELKEPHDGVARTIGAGSGYLTIPYVRHKVPGQILRRYSERCSDLVMTIREGEEHHHRRKTVLGSENDTKIDPKPGRRPPVVLMAMRIHELRSPERDDGIDC